MLYHVSEEPDISVFTPRDAATASGPVVWAIDSRHLRNYLLPRECPRVTYSAVATTTEDDRKRFLGADTAVVAIEAAWLERVRHTRLFCYHLLPDTFELLDASAGYFVSRQTATPARVEVIADALARLQTENATLRVLPNLWALHDAVAASTLEFSMIRMRNAQPRIAE